MGLYLQGVEEVVLESQVGIGVDGNNLEDGLAGQEKPNDQEGA